MNRRLPDPKPRAGRRAHRSRTTTFLATLACALMACGSPEASPITPPGSDTSEVSASATALPASASATEAPSAAPTRRADLALWPVTELPTPVPNSFGGAWPRGVVAGGPGHVAVGSASPCCADPSYDDEPWEVAIWTSTDGSAWELVPDLASFGRAGLVAVAADGSGTMLAVGYEVLPPVPDDGMNLLRMEARAWRSLNGIDWGSVGGLEGELRDVMATEAGWLVAGNIDGRPTVFSSSDLTTWATHTFDGVGSIEHLAVDAAGTVVAIGCVAPSDTAPCDSLAFTATDPGSWRQADVTMTAVRDLVAWDRGFVAVGANDDSSASRAWRSSDGLTWEAGPEIRTPTGARIITLAVAGEEIIGGGEYLGGDPPVYQPAVWRSPDGLAWEPLAILDRLDGQVEGSVRAIAITEARITALGTAFVNPDDSSIGADPYVWIGER